MAIAGARWPRHRRATAREPDGRPPIATAEAAPPGLPQPAPDATRRSRRSWTGSSPTRRRGAGSRRSSPRSVNVEFVSANPTGPLTIGNARGAFVGDLLCRVLEAGGQRVTREYYFNDSGAQVSNLGASVLRASAASRSPRTATTATTSRSSRAGVARRRLARPRRPPDADAAGRRRPLGRRPRPRRASRPASTRSASTSTSGRARLGSTTRAGSSAPSSACASSGHVYEQDGALWFRSTAFGDDKDRVDHPLRRPADVLRGRHRLRHREVQPRLRPPHLHLGRRPPRHGRPRPERRRGDGLRPRGRPDPALLVGPLRPRRRRGLDEQAGRRVHHPRRAAGRGRRRRRPLVLRVARGDDRHRLRHRAGQEAVEREPRLLRAVRPRPDRLDPAQGGRSRTRRRRRASPAGSTARPRPRWRGPSPGSRRSSRTPSPPRRRTASPPTRPSSRRRSTRSIATRGWSMSTQPERSAARLALAEATQVTLAARSGCSGSPRRTRCRRDRGGVSRPGRARWRPVRSVVSVVRDRRPSASCRPRPGRTLPRPSRPCERRVAAVSNAGGIAAVSHRGLQADGPRAVGPVRAPPAGRRPSRPRRRVAWRGRRRRPRAARCRSGTRRTCPSAGPSSPCRAWSRGRPAASTATGASLAAYFSGMEDLLGRFAAFA